VKKSFLRKIKIKSFNVKSTIAFLQIMAFEKKLKVFVDLEFNDLALAFF